MPVKAVVFALVIIMLLSITVLLVELFVPLSAKLDMNMYCRETIIKMEIDGGITADNTAGLRERLEGRGFVNIQISGTEGAMQGDNLILHVEAEYCHNSLTGIFTRNLTHYRMVCEKYASVRKVIN